MKYFLISRMALIALVALLEACATWSLHWSLESKVTPKILITRLEITNLPFMLMTRGGNHVYRTDIETYLI